MGFRFANPCDERLNERIVQSLALRERSLTEKGLSSEKVLWFQRKGESHAALQLLRRDLLRRLDGVISKASGDGPVADALVVQASSLLRLYCALRGIAGIK